LTIFRLPAHRAYSPEGRKWSNPIAFGEEVHKKIFEIVITILCEQDILLRFFSAAGGLSILTFFWKVRINRLILKIL
jgi:hypothetical protein